MFPKHESPLTRFEGATIYINYVYRAQFSQIFPPKQNILVPQRYGKDNILKARRQ